MARDDGNGVAGLEYAFAVSGMLAFGALRLLAAEADGSGPPQVPTWANVTLFAYAAWAGVLTWRRSRHGSPLLFVLALSLAYCVLSSGWSVAPEQTLKRALVLVVTTVFACYLGLRYSRSEWRRALLLTAIVLVALEFLAIYAAPAIGRHPLFDEWPGAWRGIQGHKNTLGRMAALYTLIILYAMPARTIVSAAAKMTLLLLCCALLAGAQSTTAITCLAASLLAGGFVRLWWTSPLLAATGAAAALLAGLAFVASTPDFLARAFELLGKGDMSGRLPMWSLVIDLASRRLWFGFGYEAFWSPDNPEVMRIEQLLSWSVAYSHNALLETLLNGGLVLAADMGGLLAVAFAKSLRQALAASRNYADALAFVLLAAILFSNGTESVILARADLTWILLVSAILQRSAAPGPLTRNAPVAAVRIRG